MFLPHTSRDRPYRVKLTKRLADEVTGITREWAGALTLLADQCRRWTTTPSKQRLLNRGVRPRRGERGYQLRAR